MQAADTIIYVILSLNFFVPSGGHQGLPPGVPPQHYQQQGVPQMQHVQHMQQQHVPVQQVPMQQQQLHMQQQAHMQPAHMQQQAQLQQQAQMHAQQMHAQQVQQPMQLQGGAHHSSHGQPQVLNVANIAQEKQHIAEHLSVPIDTSKMSEQELQFHYFKMHDADNNNKLDGCELIKSLIHWHEQGGQGDHAPGQKSMQEKIFKDEELVSLIDPILSLDDANSDGYIDYPEFVRAQQKAAGGAAPPSQH
ncbi:uncharacterized protein isoform X2 [Rhodnius prolixus]